ncbi:MAG TPA: nuclease [Hyphomonadaceae bacterium]|nr:nuclease [Hyphomonadaceae bacterium]
MFLIFAPSIAFADPCAAPLPQRAGESFTGVVRYVGDGDSLCVGADNDPSRWVEVRLVDFDAPELGSSEGPRSKAMLEQLALGRQARCESRRGRNGRVRSYDRVIAVCRIGGRSIGDLLREAHAPVGGN